MRRTARSVVVDFAELTDPGLDPTKQVNEDASGFVCTQRGHLAVVCDGMGGHVGGREASQLAVRTILERFQAASEHGSTPNLLDSAIQAANLAVHRMGGNAPIEARPGATCVAVILADTGALIAHVGDSRALLVRGDGVYPLTRDHSMVQQLVDAGVIAPHEAANHPDANRITRALGMNARVQVELAPTWQPIRAGDVLLLVTDGVTDLLPAHELRDVVRQQIALGPAVVCEEVIGRANARGGHDNATVQVLQVIRAPERRERTTLAAPPGPGGPLQRQLDAIRAIPSSRAPPTSPTLVDGDNMADEPTSMAKPTSPTLVDGDSMADKPTSMARSTSSTLVEGEPGLRPTAPNLPANDMVAAKSHEQPPPPAPEPPSTQHVSRVRAGLFAAIGIALLVALTALLALFVRFMRADTAAPPPIPSDSQPPSVFAETHLVADSEPSAVPTASGSATSAKGPPAASVVPTGSASAAAPLESARSTP